MRMQATPSKLRTTDPIYIVRGHGGEPVGIDYRPLNQPVLKVVYSNVEKEMFCANHKRKRDRQVLIVKSALCGLAVLMVSYGLLE